MVSLDREQYAEYITNEILKRLDFSRFPAKAPSKSLVMVDESPFGNEKDILEQISEIHCREGVTEVICIKDGGLYSSIKDSCGIDVVKGDSFGLKIYQAVDRVKNLYILNFNLSNASSICMLSDGTLICKAVQYALLTGRKVFVSDICTGFDNTMVNNGYMEKIRGIAAGIEAFGIRTIGSRSGMLLEKPEQGFPEGKAVRQVICLEDIKYCSGAVKIERNAIITPLAQEYIRDKKIKITTI
ncbi:MAG: hypothetical protein Q7J78_03695 [Clostridiales bacterium]|nr:hypothetical protein [Clostridiales bacterium]